jgi:hypothetical protein
MNSLSSKIIFFPVLFVIGCSTLREEVMPSARDPNGVMYLKNNSDSYARDKMVSNCRNLGGLNISSLYETPKGNVPEKRWYYKCNNRPIDSVLTKQYLHQDLTEGISDPLRRIDPPKPASANTTSTLSEAKKKCADLGFKAGTEDFGKCVLQISK